MGDLTLVEECNDKVKGSSRKRLRKPKRMEFVGWGSRNLIEFLQSLGTDTTNRVSETDVTTIIMKYIREKKRENSSSNKKRRKNTVDCDEKLRLLFERRTINVIKVPDLVEKHYVENQDEDDDFGFLYDSDDKEQETLSLSDKMDKQVKRVVQRPKGTLAAIVSDNVKLLYLRKSLIQELAKTRETFESKVLGTFVRIKNPCQLVQVTGVKDGNLIDGQFLQITNYSCYLEDVPSSVLSDDDFSQEECEELHQRIKNGCVKRLTVVDMEEKVRSLHEDVTKHWIARELALLQRRINQANEKGWRRELSQYLEKRELLANPEEQSRLLREIPEVVAEEREPQCVNDGVKIENDTMEPNPVAYIEANQSDEEQPPSDSPVVDSVQKNLENDFMEVAFIEAHDGVKIENDTMEPNPVPYIEANQSDEEQPLSDSPVVDSVQKNLENSKLCDGEDQQPSRTASADDEYLHEDVEEQPENDIVTENKDSIDDVPHAQSNPVEIIELSDDDDEDNGAYEQQYDPKKVMWCYEHPKGITNGPFSLTKLKEWNDKEYFDEVPDFKVWMTGKSKRSGVLLTELLHHIKA